MTFQRFDFTGCCFSTIYMGDPLYSHCQSKACGFGQVNGLISNDFSDDVCPPKRSSSSSSNSNSSSSSFNSLSSPQKGGFRSYMKTNGGDIIVTNCSFLNLHTNGSGGAFHINQRCPESYGFLPRTMEVSDCVFHRCVARNHGGTIYIVCIRLAQIALPDVNEYTADGNLKPGLAGEEPRVRLLDVSDCAVEVGIRYQQLSKAILQISNCSELCNVDAPPQADPMVCRMCVHRGDHIYVEVLEDVVFPFNAYLYDFAGYSLSTGGMRHVTQVSETTSRSSSTIHYEDRNNIPLSTDTSPLMNYYSFNRMFPLHEGLSREELAHYSRGLFVGNNTSHDTTIVRNCLSMETACADLGQASKLANSEGYSILVLDGTILALSCEFISFVKIQSYLITPLHPTTEIRIVADATNPAHDGRIIAGRFSCLYIQEITLAIETNYECISSTTAPTQAGEFAHDAVISSDYFLFLERVEVFCRHRHFEIYHCIILINNGRVRINRLYIRNLVISTPFSCVVQVKMLRYLYPAEKTQNVVDAYLSRITMENCVAAGPGVGVYMFLGENRVGLFTECSFVNMSVKSLINIARESVDPGARYHQNRQAAGIIPLVNGGAAIAVVVDSLEQTKIFPDGMGFFITGSIADNVYPAIGGKDIIIQAFRSPQDSTYTPPTIPYTATNLNGLHSERIDQADNYVSFFDSAVPTGPGRYEYGLTAVSFATFFGPVLVRDSACEFIFYDPPAPESYEHQSLYDADVAEARARFEQACRLHPSGNTGCEPGLDPSDMPVCMKASEKGYSAAERHSFCDRDGRVAGWAMLLILLLHLATV